MDEKLGPEWQEMSDGVRVEVAREQGCLEKQQGCGPDGWCPAHQGQNQFPEHRLDPEQQGGCREDCGGREREHMLEQPVGERAGDGPCGHWFW